MKKLAKPIVYSGQEWTFDLLDDVMGHLERINEEKYKLDIYTNQVEIITSEQMLDAYSANGMPVFYPHWSFGEQFVKNLEQYKRGRMGLAYEIVINSNPCISYLMEENTMLMQTLVMAHAAFGHNSFFKTNYLFKEWTNADTIIDYLIYAKKFIRKCEEEYGFQGVKKTLDAAHSLQMHGVDKYKRPTHPSAAEAEKLRDERDAYIQSQVNEIWKTVPRKHESPAMPEPDDLFPKEPQENILRFIEENAPRLDDWQREILRIVRNISQYFYPQLQTKVANEGTATFWHYTLMNDLWERGVVSDDAMLEFYTSHANVIYQPEYDSKYYSGINPYALGFAMFKDVKRISENPTDEDKKWFYGQDWVGRGDWVDVIKDISAEFKDESFVKQYLTPNVMREFRLFDVYDDEKDPALEVKAIHDDQGYKDLRNALAADYNVGYIIPEIQVKSVNRWGDRSMVLEHKMNRNIPLETFNTTGTIQNIGYLWGYDVSLHSINEDGEECFRFLYNDEEQDVKMEIYQ